MWSVVYTKLVPRYTLAGFVSLEHGPRSQVGLYTLAELDLLSDTSENLMAALSQRSVWTSRFIQHWKTSIIWPIMGSIGFNSV